jgi:hypothetical protein
MNNNNILLHKLTANNNYLKKKHNNIDKNISITNTLFILDWDDTLFPTNWITKNNINLSDSNARNGYIEYFKILDRSLSKFLDKILLMGTVIIVTNAMKDWVKISAIVLPKTYYLLKKISIISARDLFSNQFKDVMEWKKNTFQMIINKEFKNKKMMNIISIGDAEYEHQALVALTKSNFNKIKYLKSFRLIREPHYDQIIEQLDLMEKYIDQFWNLHEQICKSFKINN